MLFAFALVGSDAGADFFGAFALVHEAAAFLSGAGLAAQDAATVGDRGDPVDDRVVDDSGVGRVHEDDFKEVVHPVFADPVGVEYLHVGEVGCGAFLGDALDAFRCGDFLDASGFWFAAALDLVAVESAVSDAGADDDLALFCLVAEGSCAVDAQGSLDAQEVLFSPPLDEAVLLRGFVGSIRFFPLVADVAVHAFSHDVSPSYRRTGGRGIGREMFI